MNARLIVVLSLVGLVVLFIIQNVVVEICFLFWSLEMSRTLLMFLLLAVGVIIGWFLHGYASHRKAGRGQVSCQIRSWCVVPFQSGDVAVQLPLMTVSNTPVLRLSNE